MDRRMKALKALDSATALRGITGIRKSLIDAQKSTMLAGDDLEDILYSQAPSEEMAVQFGPAIENAIEVVKKIEDHIKAAIDLSQEAKAALRVETEATPPQQELQPLPVQEPLPEELPMRQYSYRTGKSQATPLSLRREAARKRLRNRRY